MTMTNVLLLLVALVTVGNSISIVDIRKRADSFNKALTGIVEVLKQLAELV